MKIEYNKRVYEIGNSCFALFGCSECALVKDKCPGDIGHCCLSPNEIFVYSNYSLLFEL